MKKEALLSLGLSEQQADEIIKMNDESIKKIKMELGVENALIKSKAKNVRAASALIDFDRLGYDENGISGIDEQIDVLKKNAETSFLFDEESDKKLKFVGAKAEEGRDRNKPKNIRNMTYTELCKYMK